MTNIKNKFISYINETFEIKSTEKSKKIGAVVTAVLMIAILLFNGTFVHSKLKTRWLWYSFAFILAMIIGLMSAYSVKIKKDKTQKKLFFASFIFFPLLTIAMTESLNSIWIYDMTILGFFVNLGIVMLFYMFVYALTGSIKLCIFLISPVLYGLALTHAYLMNFRGTPFIPMDFLSVTTAVNVGSTYDYSPTAVMLVATLIFAILIIFACKISTPKYHLITKLIARTFSAVFFSVVFVTFFFTDVFAEAGIKPDFWNQSRGYRNYGFVYNFACNTKYIFYPKPKNYTAEETKNYVKEKAKTYVPDKSEEKKPNIICIMNESFADLSILGDVETNIDYMPFFRSLKENTIRGNLYNPVIGAGTSNTEFEFLTGHSTAFLPSGSNAYMLYIKNPIASMVSTLMAQGYSSTAFHPYFANGWNRINVYNNMGFEIFKSVENLFDPSILDLYTKNTSNPDYLQELISTKYPDRTNMLLRQYVSDDYDFQIVIDDFNYRDKSKPFFMFNVTMQNHGGYLTAAENFVPEVSLANSNPDNEYIRTNNYLSLIKKSDDAFKKMIEYFETVEEPTIICMFGDHQPSVDSDFISETLGVSDLTKLTIEQDQKRYVTPFIIWANYDIEEKEFDKLSTNYLGSLVLKTANVKLTEYNKYLLELSKTLPVIDTAGYIDKDNNYYKWSSASEYSDLLKEYELIQYNNIFDYENIDKDSFFINGYSVNDIADQIKRKTEAEAAEAVEE